MLARLLAGAATNPRCEWNIGIDIPPMPEGEAQPATNKVRRGASAQWKSPPISARSEGAYGGDLHATRESAMDFAVGNGRKELVDRGIRELGTVKNLNERH